jgi:hypothetical protein
MRLEGWGGTSTMFFAAGLCYTRGRGPADAAGMTE